MPRRTCDVTLVDSSAWIEYLRATGSGVHHAVRELLRSDASLATTDVIVMEVLAGGRDDAHVTQLRRLLARCDFLPVLGLADYEDAAAIFRSCRRAGVTVRSLTDCVIAAVAIRNDHELLCVDRDFAAIARNTELRLVVSGPISS